MRFTGPEESLLQEVVSMEEDLQRLREEAALFVQEGSPAILAVGGSLEGEQTAVQHASEQVPHDWQFVDHRSLSQCGSSPRSLSNIALDIHDDEVYCARSPEEQSVCGEESPAPPSPLSAGHAGSTARSRKEETAAPESAGQAAPRRSAEHTLAVHKEDPTPCAGAAVDQTQEEGLDKVPSEVVPAAEDSSKAEMQTEEAGIEAFLSGHSSYADISSTSSPSVGTVFSQLSASLPEMTAAEEGLREEAVCGISEIEDLEAELSSQLSADQQALPNNGVCSIVRGCTVSSPFEPVDSGTPSSGSQMNFARLSDELPRPSLSGSSVPSLAAFSRPAGEGHWARWMAAVGDTHAGRVLRHMWGTLQMFARRLGAAVPPKLVARVQSLLRYLDSSTVPRGGKSGSRVLVAGLAAVSFLLVWTCIKNRGLSRALRARDAELQHHILTILDLNAKLTNAVDIPIARHCAYKTSLTLSHSIF